MKIKELRTNFENENGEVEGSVDSQLEFINSIILKEYIEYLEKEIELLTSI